MQRVTFNCDCHGYREGETVAVTPDNADHLSRMVARGRAVDPDAPAPAKPETNPDPEPAPPPQPS